MSATRHFWNASVLLASVAAACCWPCRADTVYLKNGNEVEGTVLEDNNNTVVIKQRNGVSRSFRRTDVDTVVYDRRITTQPAAPSESPRADGPASKAPAAEVKPTPESKLDPKANPKSDPKVDAKAANVKPGVKPDDKAPVALDEAKKADDKTAQESGKGAKENKEEEWVAPPGLPGFPKKAKRLGKLKEDAFMAALEKLAGKDEAVRRAAKDEIAELGADVLPYLVAGIQHVNVDARTTCMALLGQLNGRSAVKAAIEVFYSAMPDEGEAATYQVPFIRAIKTTLPAISGQTFITVEPDKSMVQDGLKRYIAWYNENFDRLPPQLGEEKIEPTDPDYAGKLKKARALTLAKKVWPRPTMPTDMVSSGNKNNDRPAVPSGAGERPADQAYKDSYGKVGREDALKRPQDK